ncbi:hypothetical protein PHK61_28840 [Actinomycetospora lutea]|uniref:hypothetical protein n=1 Tax=Actinomycetospora lutea TaxID=663604 RepID=UPI002366EF04|nr:hypothetical protein [Actinomycetospora lutea]MDD7942429.1 hypothetical protein [Actinomycetospora lutea]
MSRPDVVPAQVVLRPEAAGADVARKLADHGLEVLAVGRSSVSVQAPPDRIEAVFDTALDPAGPPPGVEDFGPAGARTAYRAARPLHVPADLTDEVEAVEIAEPPRMMM